MSSVSPVSGNLSPTRLLHNRLPLNYPQNWEEFFGSPMVSQLIRPYTNVNDDRNITISKTGLWLSSLYILYNEFNVLQDALPFKNLSDGSQHVAEIINKIAKRHEVDVPLTIIDNINPRTVAIQHTTQHTTPYTQDVIIPVAVPSAAPQVQIMCCGVCEPVNTCLSKINMECVCDCLGKTTECVCGVAKDCIDCLSKVDIKGICECLLDVVECMCCIVKICEKSEKN